MAMGWNCRTSKAAKRYTWRMVSVMSVYVVTVLAVTRFVRVHHPSGMAVYFWSALPTLPILAMLGVVGLFLHEESDEYQRMVTVRSLLLSIAGTLAMTTFVDFLRSYGALKTLPPFTDFVVFWVLFGVVQGVQSMLNAGGGDA